MISWNRGKVILCWLGLGLLSTFLIGCATHQEIMELKPHVNKAVLQGNDLANQVYDLENRLTQLEKRQTQTPDYVRRLADLEVRLNNLQEETHFHFTAEQENMSLLNKFDQKFQRLSQEFEDERKAYLQFEEETRKKLEELPFQSGRLTSAGGLDSSGGLPPSDGLISHGEEPEKKEFSESAPLPISSPVNPEQSAPVNPEPPGDKIDDKSTYEEIYQTFLQQDWTASQQKFFSFLDRYPDSDYADNAQFWIGESFYNQKNYEKAILEYEKVIQNYPHGDKLSSALLKQAISFQAIGRIKEAKILLNQVIEKAPDSEQAQTAKKKLESIAKEEGKAH